ncbi:MAG TPA: hypothetical protein VK153_00080 [Candidatus Paceibacterota bacterium]|nr:hypothetical protein [Candidatus Paceibacterota bacterium]
MGTFFINTLTANAQNKSESFTVTYTVSSVVSTPNSEGGTTTVVRVGCAPTSGDKYDINTGKPCSYPPTVSVRIGCAPGSPDLYDINTGKACTNKTTPVLKGCLSGSGHLFDITTGKPCPVVINITSGTPVVKTVTTPKSTEVSVDNTTKEGPGKVEVVNGNKLDGNDLSAMSLQEVTNNDSKGNERIKTIFSWPPTIQAILLAIIILLALAYGIYRFINREKNDVLEFAPKSDKSKNTPVNPIVSQPQQNQPKANPQASAPIQKPQEPIVNKAPENKIPNTPLSQPQNNQNPSNNSTVK